MPPGLNYLDSVKANCGITVIMSCGRLVFDPSIAGISCPFGNFETTEILRDRVDSQNEKKTMKYISIT
jgi:hypothetical protein